MPIINKSKINVLIVLFEYKDLFSLSGNTKQTFGRHYPAFTILLYIAVFDFKHSMHMAIITKHILLKFAPIIPAFCSLLL